jgi:uncharacterized protein DUF3568
MRKVRGRLLVLALVGLTLASSGCFLAAAGAGAGGAIYVTDRGAEAQVATPVARTLEAARSAFQEYGIAETKSSTEQDGGIEKRSLEGKTSDREVEVDLRTEGSGTHVGVVVKKSAVTWDKDFAKRILNKIVEQAK